MARRGSLRGERPSGAGRSDNRPQPVDGGSVQQINRMIHERLRLGIVSALAVNDGVTFKDLKALLKTTDGNLSTHARKLEDAGYIECRKSFEGRMPRTEFFLTEPGRKALGRYLDHMEALIDATRHR